MATRSRINLLVIRGKKEINDLHRYKFELKQIIVFKLKNQKWSERSFGAIEMNGGVLRRWGVGQRSSSVSRDAYLALTFI